MSFWEKGYTALFITSYFKNPAMHTAGDTGEKVNRRFLVRASHELVAMIVGLADE